MMLLSKGLMEKLAKAGVDEGDYDLKGAETLAVWLDSQGLDASHPALENFFGLPYCVLAQGAYLTEITLSAHASWMLYYYAQTQCYVCVRPPSEAERTAFRAQYGEALLCITDEAAVHTALLRDSLPEKQVHQGEQRVFDVRELLRQGMTHIDGLIGRLLLDAIEGEATDVHLYSLTGRFHIDFRIHGSLKPYAILPDCTPEPLFNKLKLMAEMDIAERRLPQDGHIAVVLDEETVHLRLGTLPLLDGEKIVIRLLPEEHKLATLSSLGFLPNQREKMHDLLTAGQGLLLITGPTNSGKTTTLYACLKLLAQAGKLVYTIEDPVEAVIAGVQQSQVNVRSGYGFAQGLRGMLRSDPDVLAVGELRDDETVDIAARAALSGHLVVATLHAANAQQAVNRLRDLGLSDLMLSAVLLGVVNQRLVPRSCDVCAGRGADDRGGCCMHCLGSGTVGRVGVQELWVPSEAERAQIEMGTNSVALREYALKAGFQPLSAIAREKDVALTEDEGRL